MTGHEIEVAVVSEQFNHKYLGYGHHCDLANTIEDQDVVDRKPSLRNSLQICFRRELSKSSHNLALVVQSESVDYVSNRCNTTSPYQY